MQVSKQPSDYNDTFQAVLARMEPDLFTDMPQGAPEQSMAISLRRIADLMEARECKDLISRNEFELKLIRKGALPIPQILIDAYEYGFRAASGNVDRGVGWAAFLRDKEMS